PSIIESAIRSLTEPVGFVFSSFSQSSAPFGGAQRSSLTIGVFPIASRIDIRRLYSGRAAAPTSSSHSPTKPSGPSNCRSSCSISSQAASRASSSTPASIACSAPDARRARGGRSAGSRAGSTTSGGTRAELHVRAVEAYARAGLGIGGTELAAAVRAGRTLVRSEPYRESGYRLLMEALEREGNRAEAVRVYDQLRRRLRDELGLAPSAETQDLHRRLLG